MRQEPPPWMERVVPLILVVLTLLALVLVGVAIYVVVRA